MDEVERQRDDNTARQSHEHWRQEEQKIAELAMNHVSIPPPEPEAAAPEVVTKNVVVEKSDFLAFAHEQDIDPHFAAFMWKFLKDVFIEKLAYESDNTFYARRHFFSQLPLRYESIPEPPADAAHYWINPDEVAGLELGSLLELIQKVDELAAQVNEDFAWYRLIPLRKLSKREVHFLRGFVAERQVDSSGK